MNDHPRFYIEHHDGWEWHGEFSKACWNLLDSNSYSCDDPLEIYDSEAEATAAVTALNTFLASDDYKYMYEARELLLHAFERAKNMQTTPEPEAIQAAYDAIKDSCA